MISNFTELLNAAHKQDQPQRLLFLFAKAEAEGKGEGKNSERGTLSPLMCVDKLPEEIKSFAALAKEADSISSDWNFVFVVGLSGANGKAPSSDDAAPYLNKMTNDLVTGRSIAQYAVFDRNEHPVALQAT
jgi:hypothetical protein